MGLFNFFNKKPSLSVIELQNDLRILNDCASLIEKTVNPDVFFSRFDLYYEKLSILADAQKRKIVVVKGDNIAKKYSKLNTPTAKADKINTFIKRYWDSTCSKSQKLKTEKGKNNCFENFKSSLSNYDSRLPDSCIEYYNYLYTSAPRTASMPRNQIPAKQINSMQQFKASDTYCQTIYDLYYKDYSEKPFISQDREFNTNWIEQSKMFPNQSLVSEAMMKRYPDGLLPGHIYMLYWLKKYTNKRVPSYFEYKYGIDFYKEKEFLTQNGYLENSKPTHKGELAINTHQDVIVKHDSNFQVNLSDNADLNKLKDPADINLKALELEKQGDVDTAITLYEKNVSHRFDGNCPYDRLTIIYRKKKDYDNEIRVLETAIDVFTHDVPASRSDRSIKLTRFKERLTKATKLKMNNQKVL